MAEAQALDPISLLLLSPKWKFDTYGVASIVRSLANDLWLTDPEGKRIQMTCAVLHEDGKINQKDIEDAKKHNVTLRGVKLPRGMKRLPTIEELNMNAALYYHYLATSQRFDFVVGHIPYLANAVLNYGQLCRSFKTAPKVILLAHALPRIRTSDIDEDILLEWLKDAETVFSIGDNVNGEIAQYVNCLEEDVRPLHKTYIPGCPAELLKILQQEKSSQVKGPQNVTFMTHEKKDLSVSGLDYPLAVASSTVASENIHLHCGIEAPVHLMVLVPSSEERDSWEKDFKKIKDRQPTKDKRLCFQFHTADDTEKLKSLMQRSTLMLLSLETTSSLFGVEALMAAYSGVPILVASNSGVANLLESMGLAEAVVHSTGVPDSDVKIWSERIIQKIRDPKDSYHQANALRKELLLDTTIAASHVEFVKNVTGNQQLVVDLEPKAKVLAESLEAAKKFGVKVEPRVEPNEFITAYLTKLLLQREKLDVGLLDSYLPPEVKDAWKELLSHLEQTKRKVLAVTEGSLSFTLFCPTIESYRQLQDETWRKQFVDKLTHLLNTIGITSPKPRIIQFGQSYTLPALSHLRLEDAQPDEDQSSGYGTESLNPLDQMSVMLPSSRVHHWLTGVEPGGAASSSASVAEPTELSDWVLDKTIDTRRGRPEKSRGSAMWFAVGESGDFGILFVKTKPVETDLFILPPSKPNRLVSLLSGSQRIYVGPIFIKLSGEEFLAVTCYNDASIHLWDVEDRTAHVVYQEGSKRKKEMRLCEIDSETVAYGDVWPTNDVHNVHLLNTSTDHWSLRTTLRLRTGLKAVVDMCYIQLADGTSCLVLCSYADRSIMAVEMLGGNIRWCIGTEQRGEWFKPISVCSDTDHSVYVSDFGQYKVDKLSSDDGSVISTVLTAQQHGIIDPYWVRMYNDCLYVCHVDNMEEKKWQISIFKCK